MAPGPAKKGPRAYSYLRMSTDMQLKGDSRRRQLELSQHYARQHGLELLEEFRLEDIGVSAFKGANASDGALGRFLEAVRTNKIQRGSYLLVESLDRLSRQEVLKSLGIFTEIINSGINLVTLCDQRVYKAETTDFADLIVSIAIMSRAHEESRMKSQRLNAAWVNKRGEVQNRKLTAQCPGWLQLSADKKTFKVIPERAAIIRSIFEDSVAGIGNYSITRRLNKAGISAFGSGRGWQTSSVGKILNTRAVIGEFQPHKLVNGRRAPEGDPVPDYFPAVIEEELFYRAQAARNQRKIIGAGRKGASISNLFSGLVTCAYCNSPMRFENKGPGPKGGTYLSCDRSRRGLGCEKTRWRYESFQASFLAFVQELDLESLLRSEDQAARRSALDEAIRALEGRQKALEEERESIFQLLTQTKAATEFVAKKLDDVEGQLSAVRAELSKKQEEAAALASEISHFYESKEQVKTLLKQFETEKHNPDAVYRLRSQISSKLKAIVERVFVAPAGSVPTVRLMIERLKSNLELHAHEIAELEQALDKPATNEAYFTVRFKNGLIRAVAPNPNDPFLFVAQLVGPENDLVSLESDGKETKFVGDPGLTDLMNSIHPGVE
jgi:DNA invertase Pin-like site-specific DNA recombinase